MTTMAKLAAIVRDYDQETQIIFGRECTFTQEQRDRMIADAVRHLVGVEVSA